ncbi:MAG: 50S ribosomal protein L23 [Candidatus Pacebacteria bacterium]|nr:50S ribosomal protein L23 [Candidatus Paceibacterota bacterium]
MAIFKKTTEKEVAPKAEKKAEKKVKTPAVKVAKLAKKVEKTGDLAGVLVRPHITEKAAILAEKNTYVFEVAKESNKQEIAKAIRAVYGVVPVRVNIINLPSARVFVRGKMGLRTGVRKALVTLKKGDKIEII